LRREITSKAYSDKNFSGDKDFSGVKDSPETCYVRDMIALDVSLFHWIALYKSWKLGKLCVSLRLN